MCGRYMVVTEGEIIEMQAIFEELGKRLDRSGEPLRADGGEVFPGTAAPVIVMEDKHVLLLPMLWGFRKWDNKGIIINARSETASDKPFFKESVKSKRCIIPSKGFYEWKREILGEAKKTPADKFLIRRQESPFFFMAGIWRMNEGTAEFTILTMPSVKQMDSIHDRMPLYVPDEHLINWLSDPATINALKRDPKEDTLLEIVKV